MTGRDTCIRTLDLGGDKFPLFLQHSLEQNPNMGARGLQFSLGDGLTLFKTQLEALLRVATHHRVLILLPMVLGLDDFLEAKDVILHIARELNMIVPPIGALIETPAAVLLIEEILEHADFVNLGTNDLTQFILAADRNALDAQGYYSVLYPALLRTVKAIASAAQLKDKPVTVCGEATGNPQVAGLLVGLGIRKLSMSPSLSGPVKQLLRKHPIDVFETIAKEAINANSISHVKKVIAALG